MERASRFLSDWLGKPTAFWLAGVLPILIWAAFGPLVHYTDTWQLVINTGTTVLTFLFMFLIQRAQNANSMAMQVKLDELVKAIDKANNRVINIEAKSEREIQAVKSYG